MGTEVNVDDVGLSIWNGQRPIDGFMVQYPDQFSDRSAIAFIQISLQVNLARLPSDSVVVENVVAQNSEIFVEHTAEGNNLRTLQHQLGTSSGSSGVHLVIDHLLINKRRMHLKSTIGEERNVKAEIGQLELTVVGREESLQ